MKSLLILTVSLIGIQGLTCPLGYTADSDGNCYLWQGKGGPTQRNNVYQKCAQDNAYIIDIPNAFQNSKFAIQATFPVMWMGLTCLTNSIDSCIWDNGKAMNSQSYNNFDGGSPDIELGACVYMDVSTEKWRSADCSTVAYGYGCKFTPGITIHSCDCEFPMCSTFRGKCYRLAVTQTIDDAVSVCSRYNAVEGSIHSDGENSLISGMAINYGGFGFSIFLGIQNGNIWMDGTPVDYTNYATSPSGQCKSMINGDRDIPNGKWVNSACSSSQALTFCVKEVGSSGTATTTVTTRSGSSTARTTTVMKTTAEATTMISTTAQGSTASTASTTGAAGTTGTTSAPASLNCIFVLDWLYLGSCTNATVNAIYIAQRNFMNTVATQLYATPGIIFGADVTIYGDSGTATVDPILFDRYIQDAAGFEANVSAVVLIVSPVSLCDAEDFLNPGRDTNLENIGRDCLVFFSGETAADFAKCANNPVGNPLKMNAYNFVIGAGLDGQTGVEAISNATVPVSTSLGTTDASSLVSTILHFARITR